MKTKKSKIHELKTVNRTGVSKTKQFLFAMAFLAISFMSFAQVGIGTVTPEGALDVVSTDSGVILPRVANTAAVTTPIDGMLIYDISSTCIKAYENGAWSDCLSAAGGGGGASVTNDCDANGIVGSYVAGIALNSSNTFSVTITNSSFSTADITFQSSDVTLSGASSGDITVGAPTGSPALSGGTATLTAGSSVIVTYPLTGTPSTTGTLTLDWAKLSLSCTKTVDVTGLSGAFDANYCSTTAFNGAYANAVAFSGNSFTVDITNTSGATVSSMPAPTTADLGLSYSGTGTLTVSSVSPNSTFSVANGATQTFTYTLSGTPTSVGTITATWNYADFMCTDTRNVGDGDATFTLPKTVSVVSVFDAGPPVVDIQGVMDNASNQVVVNVPYTSGAGSYDAYTSAAVAVTGEGGDSNNVTISYPAGSFSATGTIPVTVTVDGDGTFNVSKQALGIITTFATLDFQVNGTSKGNVLLDAVGGIPDRAYGDGVHDFIYLSIVGEDGNIWLNHNLGAHYADVNHASFNPTQQATAFNDHLAYGSLYQWGRLTDGHELITWTGASTGTAVNGATSTNATTDTPANALFITETNSPFDWRVPQNNSLWQGEAGINNPCPVGYRLPTEAEQTQLVADASITNYTNAASSNLAFTAAGFRDRSSGALSDVGGTSYYWSSTVSGTNASYRFFNSSITDAASVHRAYGYSVRCLKD